MTLINRRHALGLLAGAASIFSLPMSAARAALQVPIDGGGAFQPMPIAIPDFLGDGEMGPQLRKIIADNLTRSGYFTVVDQAAHIEKFSSTDTQPNFESWRVINTQALAVGSVQRSGGNLVAQYRLWDIFSSKQLDGQQFTTTTENWRRLGHIVSDAIYAALVGEKGYFDSRIVFVDEQGPKNKRVKRIALMDQDGANLRYVTQGGNELALTPRFSPNNRDISYMQYAASGDPRVVQMNTATGNGEILGNFPGMTFAPRYAPNGQKLVMSLLNADGNSSLAQMDIGSKQITKLTSGAEIDTGGCYSPDGSRIVFESDRGGGQQLYVMGTGGGAQRISFGQGRYSTPVWSPKGDLIAFTKQGGGKFSIGVMTPEGQKERILTSSFHAEGPTWSPNGRVIMFFKDVGAGPKLYTIDVSGRFEQQVATPGFASDPNWSGLLT